MSEYLTYTLWQQREQQLSQQLEHQRVVDERLREQKEQREAELAPVHEYVLVNE